MIQKQIINYSESSQKFDMTTITVDPDNTKREAIYYDTTRDVLSEISAR